MMNKKTIFINTFFLPLIATFTYISMMLFIMMISFRSKYPFSYTIFILLVILVLLYTLFTISPNILIRLLILIHTLLLIFLLLVSFLLDNNRDPTKYQSLIGVLIYGILFLIMFYPFIRNRPLKKYLKDQFKYFCFKSFFLKNIIFISYVSIIVIDFFMQHKLIHIGNLLHGRYTVTVSPPLINYDITKLFFPYKLINYFFGSLSFFILFPYIPLVLDQIKNFLYFDVIKKRLKKS